MSKTETLAKTENLMDIPEDYERILAEYGVTASDLYAPAPPMTVKQNFDQLCTLDYPIYDERDNLIKCEKHSGPMIFLEKGQEIDGDKFEGYDGFYIYTLLHPKLGKTVVTLGRPEGERKPAVASWFDTLKPGAAVHVAMQKTSNDYRIFVPVPPQQPRKS